MFSFLNQGFGIVIYKQAIPYSGSGWGLQQVFYKVFWLFKGDKGGKCARI
jgi:hypothetical protein